MRIILMLLVLAGSTISAQPLVLPLEKSLALTLSADGNERQYAPVPSNVSIYKEVRSKLSHKVNLNGAERDSLRTVLIRAAFKVLDSGHYPDFMVNAKVCFTGRGEISHVFFTIKPFFFRDIDQLMVDKLPVELTKQHFVLSQAASTEVPISFYLRRSGRNSARNIAWQDSTLTTSEELRTCIDTLRIKRLNLSSLDLNLTPKEIYRFPNLEQLDLHDNKISSFNLEMRRLPRLRHIDLSANQLDEKNIVISKNKSVRILNLQKNAMADIPESIRENKGLRSLWLGGNALGALNNRSFKKLRQLEDLNLYNNGLVDLPFRVRKLKRLKVIDLYYNEFIKIPRGILKLRRLEWLAVSHNRVETIDPEIGNLKRLHAFYAHHNRLNQLPAAIYCIKNLTILDLGYNQFSNFPNRIADFSELKELDLSYNKLNQFPAGLTGIMKLRTAFLAGNPFVKNLAGSEKLQLEQLRKNGVEVFH
jgi:Leucine-rich repeat (LRR) protein